MRWCRFLTASLKHLCREFTIRPVPHLLVSSRKRWTCSASICEGAQKPTAPQGRKITSISTCPRGGRTSRGYSRKADMYCLQPSTALLKIIIKIKCLRDIGLHLQFTMTPTASKKKKKHFAKVEGSFKGHLLLALKSLKLPEFPGKYKWSPPPLSLRILRRCNRNWRPKQSREGVIRDLSVCNFAPGLPKPRRMNGLITEALFNSFLL